MKHIKKFQAAFLAVCCLVGLLAGCGSDEGNTEPSADPSTPSASDSVPSEATELEHMDISLAIWDVETCLGGGDSDKVLKTIEDKFNVTFVPMNITWGDYSDKLQMWAASDSLPDVFAGDFRTSNTFSTWVNDGILKEIPEDLSVYPNLEKYMDSPEKDTCMVDGKTYCIFRQTYLEQAKTVEDRAIYYRWDLAQAAGVEKEPTTWDEFRAMIQKIIQADPEGKKIAGMTAASTDLPVGMLFCYSMPAAVVGGNTFKWVDNGDGTYVPAYFAGKNLGDDALATWKLAREMYQEGTIDADIALANLDTAYNKFLNGQNAAVMTAGFGGVYNGMLQYWDEMHDVPAEEAVKVLDLMPGVDGKTYYWEWDYAWSESYISGNVDDAKLDRILQIYDYLLSDEGVMMSRYGFEGDTYNIADGKYIETGDTSKYPSIGAFSSLVAWTPELPNGYEFKNTEPQWLVDRWFAMDEVARNLPSPETKSECTQTFISLNSGFGLHLPDDLVTIMTSDRPVEDVWKEIMDAYKADGLEDIITKVNELVK